MNQSRYTGATRLALWLSLLAALLMTPVWISAQQVAASITGTVTDKTGAVIPGAKVTITSVERGTTLSTTTNVVGLYVLPNVPIGHYTESISAKGFKTASVPAFELTIGQAASIPVTLQLGSQNTTVQVTASAPLLNTQNATLNTIMEGKAVQSLPLASKNYIQLTLLSPGAVTTDPGGFTNAAGDTVSSGHRPYINGNREQENNFLLDGMDNNQVSDNLVAYIPATDAIAEYSVITQNPPASYGNFMGGTIATSIKSGTNKFHGELFEWLGNDKLNAASWATNLLGTPNARAANQWNVFGGSIGGPIVKNKLFFFADTQYNDYNTPSSTATLSVMDSKMRSGDFSELCPAGFTAAGVCSSNAGGNIQLVNPANGQDFANNQIPATMEDSVAAAFLSSGGSASQFYPAGNTSGLVTFDSHSFQHIAQGDVRIDYQPSQNNSYFLRYSVSNANAPTANGLAIVGSGYDYDWTHNAVADWVHILSPTMVNDARFGVNYVKLFNGAQWTGLGNLATAVGIQDGNPVPGMPILNISGTGPAFAIGAGGTVGGGTGNGVNQLFADTVIQASDDLAVTLGRHSLHYGMELLRQRIDTYYSQNAGQLGYIDYNGTATGAAAADFFLGDPSASGRGSIGGVWGQRSWNAAAYIQDNWQVNDNLTLNLGLRYDDHTPWTEVHNRQINFGLYNGLPEQATPSDPALYNSYNGGWDFQPRLGFAWTGPDGYVVRGGWSVSSYLEGTGTNLRLPINPPLGQGVHANFAANGSATGWSGNTETAISSLSVPGNPYAHGDLRVWDPNVRPAVSNAYNLQIERQLGSNQSIQVGYVGQKNTHLMVPMDYTQFQINPTTGAVSNGLYLGEGTSGSVFVNTAGTGDGATARGTGTIGNQTYNSLQAVWKFTGSSLNGQLAYTYSKCMTDSSGYYGSWGGQTAVSNAYFAYMYNQKAEWGPCYYDATHVLTGYATYDLPIGHGKAIGRDWNGITQSLLGGWQVGAILTLHGGFAMTTYDWGTSEAWDPSFLAVPRADCNGPVQYINQPVGADASTGRPAGIQWFSPNSFSTPSMTQIPGTCSNGDIRGPGMFTVDTSLSKHFQIGEGKDIALKAQAVNAFNHTVLSGASTGYDGLTLAQGSTMGVISGSQFNRVIRLSLKLTF